MMRLPLDLSTGHLSRDTDAWRGAQLADAVLRGVHRNRAEMIAGGKTRYGWFSYAPDHGPEGLTAGLATVLTGRQQGAEYVLLDCEPPHPDLPVLGPAFLD